ncbi:ABC transporter ATP-binding protein [Longispora sp. NPDC051575]|uniref:ABC transporter ATP-binding protein n=1 Tax=Longispora sp. NPDC051575 TaxID=3154943 RepID=UPI00342DC676
MTVIELCGAGLTYPGPPPVPALRPADLTVRRGEYVSIVGPSGSGKSTLLNVLGLLDRPTEGRFLLDGVDTASLKDHKRTALRAHRIGFVFQAFHLLAQRTAVENVALAQLYRGVPAKQRTARAREALHRVGMGHRLDSEPSRLSGGERQRVAIARALAADPSLLLCDEPTGNLDSANAANVLDLIDGLHGEGMTVLMITHDQAVSSRAQRQVSIRDGVLTT